MVFGNINERAKAIIILLYTHEDPYSKLMYACRPLLLIAFSAMRTPVPPQVKCMHGTVTHDHA